MSGRRGSSASVRAWLRGAARGEVATLAGTGVLVQVLNLASGPLVARMLGPDGRGRMVIVMVVMLLVSQLTAGGYPAAVAHAVAEAEAPARDVLRPRLRRWAGVSVVAALAAPAMAALFLRGSPELGWLLVLAFTTTLVATWQFVVAGMLAGEGNTRAVSQLALVGVALYVGGVLAMFVLAPSDRPAVVLTIYAVCQPIGLACGWSRLRRPEHGPPDEARVASVSAYARRSVVSGANALGLGLDHLVVAAVLGSTSLGLYAVAVSVTNLPSIVLAGLAAMLLPRLVVRAGPERRGLLRRWLLATVAIDLALVVALQAVVGPAIRIAFGEEFAPAVACARWMIVAWALLALRRVLTSAAQAQGRAWQASAAEGGSLVVLVAASYLGSELGGITGAAIGFAGAGAVACLALAPLALREPAAT